jgi:hypothetical protein
LRDRSWVIHRLPDDFFTLTHCGAKRAFNMIFGSRGVWNAATTGTFDYQVAVRAHGGSAHSRAVKNDRYLRAL